MATFTVASYSFDGVNDLGGQSFTPNVPGPDGSGDPGSATQVFIRRISLGYPSANTSLRTGKVYIYSVELSDAEQIGQSDYLVAESLINSVVDGTNLFGTGTYQRTFNFNAGIFVPGNKYFIYFEVDQHLRVKSATPYSGGNAQDDQLSDLPAIDAQFQVEMYT
jgi:hypothetical protein